MGNQASFGTQAMQNTTEADSHAPAVMSPQMKEKRNLGNASGISKSDGASS